MRESPSIIKAINALKSASSDEPIHHIPYISERMANVLSVIKKRATAQAFQLSIRVTYRKSEKIG